MNWGTWEKRSRLGGRYHWTALCYIFQYMPPVEGRASVGFVGLRNGGATCYMNSVIQQLFMTPGVVEHLLGIDEENVDEER